MARSTLRLACAVAAGGALGALFTALAWHARRLAARRRTLRALRLGAAGLRPKVELHVHLDGALDAGVLFAEAKRTLARLPVAVTPAWDASLALPVRAPIDACATVDDFRKLVTCKGKRSLLEMIKCFEVFTPIVRGKPALLEELARRFVHAQFAQNVVYTEARGVERVAVVRVERRRRLESSAASARRPASSCARSRSLRSRDRARFRRLT
jgi:hypothetical protein